jgi:hypothetical protein
MLRIHKNTGQTGATLVEVLVAMALTGLMLPALTAAIITSSYDEPNNSQSLIASGLVQQLITATKNIRDNSWSSIETNGTYYPVLNGHTWTLSSGSELNGDYTESVVINSVFRDSNGNIVSSGGTLDPSTKQIIASASWTSPRASSVTNSIYLSRWQNENSWTQTSVADFAGDTLTNLEVTDNSGGEVQLVPGQTSGNMESSTFDAGSEVSFNLLTFTNSIADGTTMQFQIATNNDGSTWNYVGPDGTSSTYFTNFKSIPLSQVSARYFRYKVYLNTTNSNSPILNDVSVSYTP